MYLHAYDEQIKKSLFILIHLLSLLSHPIDYITQHTSKICSESTFSCFLPSLTSLHNDYDYYCIHTLAILLLRMYVLLVRESESASGNSYWHGLT